MRDIEKLKKLHIQLDFVLMISLLFLYMGVTGLEFSKFTLSSSVN
jgi:hypothetical protein